MLEFSNEVVYRFNNKEDMLHFVNNVNWVLSGITSFCDAEWDRYARDVSTFCIRIYGGDGRYLFNYCDISWYEEMGYEIELYVPNTSVVELL